MLSFKQFSKHLIVSGDLDPDYIFINNVCEKLNWNQKQKSEWIALKSIIYDSIGELEFLLDNKNFENVKYGTERRKHKRNSLIFYGAIKETSREHGGFYEYFMSLPENAEKAMKELQKVKGVGPWASWKIIDLVSCCLGKKFDFKNLDFRMAYEYPVRGMLLLNGVDEQIYRKIDDNMYKKCLNKVYELLGDCLKLKAPPQRKRKINLQEIETCLCKYHSYYHGHYYVGHDIDRLHKRIKETSNKQIKELRCELPKQLILWGQDLQVVF